MGNGCVVKLGTVWRSLEIQLVAKSILRSDE